MNIKQAIHKINKVQYVNIYNIYRFINHKIMSERAKEITKNNNADN